MQMLMLMMMVTRLKHKKLTCSKPHLQSLSAMIAMHWYFVAGSEAAIIPVVQPASSIVLTSCLNRLLHSGAGAGVLHRLMRHACDCDESNAMRLMTTN